MVEAVKKELNLPELKVRYNLVTSQTRIPLVQNGTVDIECGSTTNNEERQKQVDFSVGIFEVGTRLLSKKTANIKDFDDLKGKNVVTTAGTTSERLLKAMNADKKMGMNIISAKDHGESFMMLESGRAVAFMMDDALLSAKWPRPRSRTTVVGGTPQSFEIYGCMVRKGDAAFKKVVDKAITDTSLRRGQQDLRQVVHPADPAEGPEPQLPHERRAEEADRQPDRQGRRADVTSAWRSSRSASACASPRLAAGPRERGRGLPLPSRLPGRAAPPARTAAPAPAFPASVCNRLNRGETPT